MSNQNIELETAELEQYVVMGEALERLRKNPDWNLVIEEGYLKDKPLASVSLLAVPQVQAEGRRPGLIEDLISCSNLNYFFGMIEQFHAGATADPVLSDEEEAELQAQEDAINQSNSSEGV